MMVERNKEPEMEDGLNLLTVLPEEIWEIIFSKYLDPDSLQNCAKASSFFKELLERKKNLYLFPAVLKILVDNDYLKCTRSFSHRYSRNFVKLTDVRIVCRSWKAGVKSLLDDPNPEKNVLFKSYAIAAENKLPYVCIQPTRSRIFTLSALKTLVNNACQLDANPFPMRRFQMSYYSTNDSLARQEQKLLTKSGHHIWYAKVVQSWYSDPTFDSVAMRNLRLVPNLKFLHIFYNKVPRGAPNFELKEYECGEFPSLSNLQVLILDRVPLILANKILAGNIQLKVLVIPEFHNSTPRCNYEHDIEWLPGDDPSDTASDLSDDDKLWFRRVDSTTGDETNLDSDSDITSYGESSSESYEDTSSETDSHNSDKDPMDANYCQKSAVESKLNLASDISSEDDAMQETRSSQSVSKVENDCLHSLKALQNLHTFSADIPEMKYFRGLPENWNLRVLRLDLSLVRGDEMCFNEVFEKIECYGNTLTNLYLRLPKYLHAPKWVMNKWNLPNVKTLEFRCRNYCNLDFLLGLQSLQKLLFKMRNVEDDYSHDFPHKETRFVTFDPDNAATFQNCSIWEWIPTLREAELRLTDEPVQKFYRSMTKNKSTLGKNLTWTRGKGGTVPEYALFANDDDEHKTYIARAYYRHGTEIGTLHQGEQHIAILSGRRTVLKSRYEILTGLPNMYRWIKTTGENIHSDAFFGGRDSLLGVDYAIGRVFVDGVFLCGKVIPSQGCCSIYKDGAELRYPNYELLVRQQEK